MKQIPERSRPAWLEQLLVFAALFIVTAWMVTLLPVLLVVGLIAAVLVIPVLISRSVRKWITLIEVNKLLLMPELRLMIRKP